MASARCPDCHATMVVPEHVAITTMTCGYCGAAMAVPDADARRRHQLDLEREARLREDARAARERQAAADADARAERRDRRRQERGARWWLRLTSLLAMLTAPVIIAITVFDLPARLGYGPDGADRLRQMSAQLQATGCTVLAPIRTQYATGAVSKLVQAPPGCIRVLAAGAGDHRSLGLRLFGPDGTQLGQAGDTLDPQLAHCAPAAALVRYEIVVGPAAKGRLSHTVLACPAAPPPRGR
ncbi:MAG: hypothetical protein R3B06_27735 [Kofleriaceae bacterium]